MTKVIYFRERTDAPIRVVRTKPGQSGCLLCYFKGHPAGCPKEQEEHRAGAGRGCIMENHHYEKHECES